MDGDLKAPINPEKVPRSYKKEFTLKILERYGTRPSEERQTKIMKKIEKQRQ